MQRMQIPLHAITRMLIAHQRPSKTSMKEDIS